MNEGNKKIDKTLLERIFTQIDTHNDNIIELTRITGEHSSSISILKKIMVSMIVFIVISSISLPFFFIKTEIKSNKNNKVTTNEKVKVDDKENDEIN